MVFNLLEKCNADFFKHPKTGDCSSYSENIQQHYQQVLNGFSQQHFAQDWQQDNLHLLPDYAAIMDALEAAKAEFSEWLAVYGEYSEQIRRFGNIELINYPNNSLLRFNIETNSGRHLEIFTSLGLKETDDQEAIWVKRIIHELKLDLILRIQLLKQINGFSEADSLFT